MKEPLISACLISYNQSTYIEEALNGILKQNRKGFKLEVVAGDDCSTDGTADIIRQFATLHPEIRVSERHTNLGMHGNWQKTITECQGDYIAIIEGDDRWDDENKLSKQLKLLEHDQTAVACFSNAKVLKADNSFNDYDYVDVQGKNQQAAQFLALNFNPIPTCTTFFRNSAFKGFPASYFQSPFADWILHSILIQKGNYLYLNECSSSYRQHDEGVWSGIKKERQLLNKLKAIQIILEIVEPSHRSLVKVGLKKQLDELLYFYRENGNRVKYFKTWMHLKFAS